MKLEIVMDQLHPALDDETRDHDETSQILFTLNDGT